MTPVRIICMGNELVCDDGIAMRVGRVLQRLSLPDHVQVEFQPQVGIDLMDSLNPGERLILVDAARTGAPAGTCTSMTLAQVSAVPQAAHCCHALGLPEVLRIASKLMPERLPEQIIVVGIEALTLHRFGTELSPAVRRALPVAVRVVLELVQVSREVVARGEVEAEAATHWDPQPVEAFGG